MCHIKSHTRNLSHKFTYKKFAVFKPKYNSILQKIEFIMWNKENKSEMRSCEIMDGADFTLLLKCRVPRRGRKGGGRRDVSLRVRMTCYSKAPCVHNIDTWVPTHHSVCLSVHCDSICRRWQRLTDWSNCQGFLLYKYIKKCITMYVNQMMTSSEKIF